MRASFRSAHDSSSICALSFHGQGMLSVLAPSTLRISLMLFANAETVLPLLLFLDFPDTVLMCLHKK